MDDDVYVIMDNLVKLLSKMDPKTEARYIGNAGTRWKHPLPVSYCFYITVSILYVSVLKWVNFVSKTYQIWWVYQ